MATIAVLGTLDSKGQEHQFLAERIRARGLDTLMIDVGTGGEPVVAVDITRDEVGAEVGLDLAPLLARADRGECVSATFGTHSSPPPWLEARQTGSCRDCPTGLTTVPTEGESGAVVAAL